MRNARLDEAQAGTKIARRNINNLRYADDTTLMAESEEKLKSLLMKVKQETEKNCLKLNIQKTLIMAPGPITSWQIDEETMETETFFWGGASKSLQMVTAAMKFKRHLLLGRKVMTNLDSLLKRRDITLSTKSPSPPVFNLPQHQGLYRCVGSLHQAFPSCGKWAPRHRGEWPPPCRGPSSWNVGCGCRGFSGCSAWAQ